MDVRCESSIQFRVEDGRIEVKCRSKRCGAGNGIVVLHYFDMQEFKLTETVKFKSPDEFFERNHP